MAPHSTVNKKLKKLQIAKLKKLALGGRHRIADRAWAASQLSANGIEIGANRIPGYANPKEGLDALLNAEGGCITAVQAREIYPVAMRGVVIRCKTAVPVWQFSTKRRLIPGITDVLKILERGPGASQLDPFTFFLQPASSLNLRTPLEALRNGDIEAVLMAAQATGR